MKKIIIFMLIGCLGLSLVACGDSSENTTNTTETISDTTNTKSDENNVEEIPNDEISNQEPEATLYYFKSDSTVNNFFTQYNAISENSISADEIKKGNIRTKALVYKDEFSLEVINVNDETLAISIGAKPENEETVLFTEFSNCIKATNTTISDDEIISAWKAIHETGYMIEGYDFNGITITYIPSKELSWGTNNPRVDLTIPIE